MLRGSVTFPVLRVVVAAALGALFCASWVAPERIQTKATFAAQVAALSEPEGYFDTDNLISNERSYLQVLPELERANIYGGAYVGVGPDQNFTYIAAIRPTIAFIVDIRRDNLLLHLLFKALFQTSQTRVEYLARLLGRPVPGAADSWRAATIDRLVAHVDGTPMESRSVDLLRAQVRGEIKRIGVPLSREDIATIDRFHRRFIESGLSLRFQTTGRPPQSYYPTYRELLLERDPLGRHGNYLASEDAFQFVKSLHARDLIIPVVGDLSGPAALTAIGRLLRESGVHLSVTYSSNVEDYLFRQGRFAGFVANLKRMPHTERSVVIRSIFGQWIDGGNGSISRIQPVTELLDGFTRGRFQRYGDLVGR
jgi:hypothetical protein